MSQAYSFAYFYQELCAFRTLAGDRQFWKKPIEVRDRAIGALGFVYLNLDPELSRKDVEKAQVALDSALLDYSKREFYVTVGGLS